MEMTYVCTCGTPLEVSTINMDNRHVTISLKPCAQCEDLNIRFGYDMCRDDQETADSEHSEQLYTCEECGYTSVEAHMTISSVCHQCDPDYEDTEA